MTKNKRTFLSTKVLSRWPTPRSPPQQLRLCPHHANGIEGQEKGGGKTRRGLGIRRWNGGKRGGRKRGGGRRKRGGGRGGEGEGELTRENVTDFWESGCYDKTPGNTTISTTTTTATTATTTATTTTTTTSHQPWPQSLNATTMSTSESIATEQKRIHGSPRLR